MARILVIDGHPDTAGGHFIQAAAQRYADGARAAGHEVRSLQVAHLDFPLLRDRKDWETGTPCPDIARAQADLAWAEHIVILHPLWLGCMPALLKGFLEQVLRPGAAVPRDRASPFGQKPLSGRSARIVVTMGMPAFFYRWVYGAHSVKLLKRNILQFCGIGPVRTSIIGMIEGKAVTREKWLQTLQALGTTAK
jgi:putative NADPH-quinone reductase